MDACCRLALFPTELVRDAGSALTWIPSHQPHVPKTRSRTGCVPEGHLEHLPLVDVLGPVVIAVKHLPKEGIVELGIRLQALGALTDVRQHQAGLPIRGQLVLLHAPAKRHELHQTGWAPSNRPGRGSCLC